MADDFIPTRGSSKKSECQKQYQSITFESYKSKEKHKSHVNKVKSKELQSEESIINIKKAKHEIVKFGMSGFDAKRKEEAKIQLAIKLGAKPPKNKYKNYRLLKEERAKEKLDENKMKQFQQLGKNALGKSTAKKKKVDSKRRKVKSGILDIYGKVKVINKS